MDRIMDSGSIDWGSTPHGRTLYNIIYLKTFDTMNTKLKLYLIINPIFLLVNTVLASSSIEPQIVNYSAASGLPSNEVTSIAEDDMGMMWFGTTNGLARFDGYEFKVFRSDYLSPSFFKSNSISLMKKAPDGKLWIVTNKEVAVFDTKTQSLRQVDINKNLIKRVKSLLVSKRGEVYLGTTKGLYLYNIVNNVFEKINYEPLNRLFVNSIYEDNVGNIWIGTWSSGFYKYNPYKKYVYSYKKKFDKILRVTDFAEDNQGRLWVSTWESHGLVRVDEPNDSLSDKIKIFPVAGQSGMLRNPVMYKMDYDAIENKLWIATADGLFLMNDLENPLSFESFQSSVIKGSEVWTLFRSSKGMLWTSVLGGGVNSIIQKRLPFNNICNHINNENSSIITALYESHDSNIWIGTRMGILNIYEEVSSKILDYKTINILNNINKKSNAVVAFAEDKVNRRLWIATRYDGVYCIEGRNIDNAKMLRIRDLYPDMRFMNSLIIDNDYSVWCSAGNKLYSISLIDGIVQAVQVKPINRILGDNNITSLCKNEDNLWIGTDAAGIIWYNKKEKIKKYNVENNKLVYDNVLSIFSDSNNNIWVGTNGGGLNKYDKRNDCFSMIPSVQAVSDYIIYSIIEDNASNLWMATGKGICKMDMNNENSVRLYTSSDGLKNNQFIPNVALRLSDSRLLFGGYNGIDCYNPEMDVTDSLGLRTAIVDISVMNIPIRELYAQNDGVVLPPYTNNLHLPYNQNNLMLTFSGLAFMNPNSIGYAYKMEGLDKDWIYVDADQRHVSYNNLQPGKYIFLVSSTNETGIWSPTERLEITILPPPWLTWWAYIVYIIILTIIVYVSYRIIHNRIKLQNELRIEQIEHQKSDEVNQVKLKFFTNISHELFTPLSVMQCSVESLKMDKVSDSHTLDIMQINLRRLKRLLQQIMEFRKVESGNLKLKVSYNDIVPFIKNVCAENFQPLLERNNISMNFRCEKKSMFVWFDIDKLDKILYNLLSNALKYNYNGGVITVSLKETEENGYHNVVIVVENTGEGIPENKIPGLFRRFYEGDYRKFHTQGTGIGLSLTKDLVELHHGKISVSSIVGQITSFSITFPADKSGYSQEEIDENTILPDKQNEQDIDIFSGDENKSDILLVEDDPDLLSIMSKVLGKVYNVHSSTNGKEAMRYLKSEGKADIIITDYVMPEMDGIELCKSIRSDAELFYLPIVMLTAKTQSEFQKLGYDAGADVYLPKPVEMSVLIAQINSIISNRRMIAKKYLSEDVIGNDIEEKEIGLSEADKDFLDKVVAIIEENLDDSEFTNDILYDKMNTTQSTMYRRLKSITGLSPNELIRDIRIKKACELLKVGKMQVSEVAYAVGFTDPKYFSLIFKKVKGMSPKKYVESLS